MWKFSKKGDSWKVFERQLDAYVKLNDIGEDKAAMLLITRLSPKVFEELQAVCEPEDPLTVKYTELKEKLAGVYAPKENDHLVRFSFRERKQAENESIKEFFLALQTLAK